MCDACCRIPFDDCHRPFKVVMSSNELGSADPARGRGSLDAARGETAWRRGFDGGLDGVMAGDWNFDGERSEEHTSELQSLMRISYAVFCLKKKREQKKTSYKHITTGV